ncbi:MAG: transposase domain-containing protein [Streptosporangiaceae bacterium]
MMMARAGLATRVLSGPGLWLDWLEELDRASLLEELLDGDVISRALAQAPHGHAYDSTLNARMTVISVIMGCLFPGQGYDGVLAAAFGLPGLHLKPGTAVPTGPAFSKARALLGEQVMKRASGLDAAHGDADLGIGTLWKGMEVTALDGTTAEAFANEALAAAFGVPEGGTKPKLRLVAHVRAATRRWIAAAAGGYLDGENTLADELASSFRPGMINLADRGFLSMDRWLRFSAAGAHLAWRVKNGANRSRSGRSAPCPAGRSWSCSANRTACGRNGAVTPATPPPPGCRTPSPGWPASPSPPAPPAAGPRRPPSRS